MTEVPIIFPSTFGSANRFVVNDVDCTIRRSQNEISSGLSKKKKMPLLDDVISQTIQSGSASMSYLNSHQSATSSSPPVILTTSVVMENPRVLSVALTGSGNNPDFPVIVELDLASEIQHYGNTVKVEAFVEERSDSIIGQGDCIRLVLVADNAVVITIRLRNNNLTPYDEAGVEVFNVRDLLSDTTTKEAVSGSAIRKTTVAFTNPTTLVMALSPLLMSVDLQSRSCEIWLESQTLEDMRARESTIGSIFSSATNLLLGRLDDGALVDMAPTSALCVSSTANPLLDSTFVFTLHSDGTIRKWTIGDLSLRPAEVYPITISDLPSPRDWSDMHNSAYLSARTYSHVYVLAVHIQTNSGSLSMVDDDENGEMGSSSCLFVVYGDKDSKVQAGEPTRMIVPKEARGLVDMDFTPNSNSCSLTAMFQSVTSDIYGSTLSVLYPPSVVSIISTQPEITPIDYLLDGVAQSERKRISSLLFSDELEGGASLNLPLEDEIHEMDCRFMKYLFRPAYPRGSGTVTAPKDFHIRNAIQKVIYGRMRLATDDVTEQSIQLETLRALQDWRARENRQFFTSMTPQKEGTPSTSMVVRPATSVYDTYVASANDGVDDDGDNDESDMGDSNVDQIERERVHLLEMHACRWRRLLLAIWEEECALRLPIGFFLLPNAKEGAAILTRSGCTSLIADPKDDSVENALARLDSAALKLMQSLESDDDSRDMLYCLEQGLWNNMAKAQLDDLDPSDFAEGFSKAVDSAFDSHAESVAFSAREQQQLGQSLGTIPLEDYFLLLQDTPRDKHLPGLNVISPSQTTSREPTTPRSIVANHQARMAVCALTLRCIDSSRKLLLGRYCLLSYMVRSSQVSTVAFYAYLRSLGVMWGCAQEVSLPAAFSKSSSAKALSDQPPKKRLSFGDSSYSILTNSSTKTTCMDARLISILQSRPSGHETGSSGAILALSGELFCSSMRSTVPKAADVSSGKLLRLLPELGALPPSSNSSIATDNPRIALRLIAPLVGLSGNLSGIVSPNVVTARAETFAECILVESHSQLSEAIRSKMRTRACELLATSPMVTGDLEETMKAFNFLMIRTAGQRLSENAEGSLAQILQKLIHGTEAGAIRREIARLVKLETVQMLLGCLLNDAQHGLASDVMRALQILLPRLQHLSNSIHRVDLLEHHVGRSKGSNDFVLQFISTAIREVKDSFPVEVCRTMPEYLSLYNRLFHNAVSSREWDQAYDACVNNPSVERKTSNFKVLVNSMTDAGSLQELMSKCSTLALASGMGAADSVDLYAIAADALREACSRDLYLVRANAADGDASRAAPFYQGSLYALHASQGQWRRAAQALDLQFVNAIRSLATVPSEQSESATALLREHLIVEDLVLASVGTANASSLVDDTAAQYIISGEQGQLPSIQIEALEAPDSSTTKRGRNTGNDSVSGEPPSLDRISQFMDLQDVRGRATWSFALRKLSQDTSSSAATQKSALLAKGNPNVDKAALEELSDRGYYLTYLLLTLAMSKTGKGGGVRHAFYNSLLNLLSNKLMPMSYAQSLNTARNRPSISQICGSLDSVGALPGRAPFVAGNRFKHHSTAMESCLQEAASKLMQKLSLIHTSAEHPAGLHLANCILEYDDSIAQLPPWLKRLLMEGNTAGESPPKHGLFDKRPESGDGSVFLGNPSALLTLYLSHGMLMEACAVVVEGLSSASMVDLKGTLLPEKGEIVFVPYKKIDILFHLIDSAIGKPTVDEETKSKLRDGQQILLESLQKHLERMKTNETGLRSARHCLKK